MTFDEWYNNKFPGDWNLAILAKSPPALERYAVANAAWEAALEEALEYQRELERLAAYDRSVFGDS